MNNRVVILTASTGYGHNQVALSMKNELEAKGCRVWVIEPFKEVSRSLNILLSDGYRLLATKMPKVYGKMYHISNKRFFGKPVDVFSSKVIENKLEEIVNEFEPDLVISTHPFIVKAMCKLKRKNIYTKPFVSVVTDYMPHKSYLSPIVDAYIVGSKYTKDKLVERKIECEKIFAFGIPINRAFKEFKNSIQKESAFTILLMGGSMGMNGIKKAFKELLNIQKPLKIIVVCGNNENLKKTLEERLQLNNTNAEVLILGFTDKIAEYMDSADLIITKPGGLTVTEAFAKNLPMVIPFFIPGQEEENAEMLTDIGAAVKVHGPKALRVKIEEFIENPILLEAMKKSMFKVSRDHSLDKVTNLCLKLIEEGQEQEKLNYAE